MKQLSRTLAVIVVFAISNISCSLNKTASVQIEVRSEFFGGESDWVEDYCKNVVQALVQLLDNPTIQPPAKIPVTLGRDSDLPGIGGFATPSQIGFQSDVWPKDKYRLWIIAHELTNMFVANYGSNGGGYPSDWWSNGTSPFPEYVSCLILEKLGHTEEAKWRRAIKQDQKDHQLYWSLHDEHGFTVFATFFKLLRQDGIELGRIGEPFPHPDSVRSAYTIAYLSLAARENLASQCREHGIGKKPGDWEERHSDIEFTEYEVTAEQVDQILRVRKWLFEKGNDSSEYVTKYRMGSYAELLNRTGGLSRLLPP